MSWIEEFGVEYAIPQQVLDLEKQGTLWDLSWHNDAMPSFYRWLRDPGDDDDGDAVILWIEHPDADQRETPEWPRFTVSRYGHNSRTFYDGDDVNAALTLVTEMTLEQLYAIDDDEDNQ